jgi:hypothetical protein
MWARFETGLEHSPTLIVVALWGTVVVDILNRRVLVNEVVAILNIPLTAETELAVGHQVSVGVIFINWLIKPRPLLLIGIPAETVESLALELRLPQTSFGYACLVSGWRASSRTG